MNNPFAKKQFRIYERIDSNGKSTFYPERTILGFWTRYTMGEYGDTSFDSFKEANDWMCYKYEAKANIHKTDEVFNKLVK